MDALGNIDQQYPDDNSSDSSFSLGSDDNHSIIEDESNVSSESDEPAIDPTNQPTAATAKPSSSNRIYEVTRLSYRDFSIGIFSDSQEEPRRFFFEPIVLLDPTTISIESDHILKQNNLIRFKIKMWTKELRSEVLARLRFLYHDIDLDDISVIPYEKLKLVVKPGSIIHKSARLVEETISYKRLSESIPFYFVCDSEDSATILADYLRRNTELALERCQVVLECDGLRLPSQINPSEVTLPNRPTDSFDVSTFTEVTDRKFEGVMGGLLNFISSLVVTLLIIGFCLFPVYLYINQDAQGRLIHTLVMANQTSANLISHLRKNQDAQGRLIDTFKMPNKNSTNVVPVFSVISTCGGATDDQYITFSTSEFQTETKHGDFDLTDGLFTVKTAGIYQLNFNGHVRLWFIQTHHFELRVNGKKRAVSYISSSSKGYQQLQLSALIHLYIGDKVGVFRIEGQLHGKPDSDFTSTFSGILIK